MVLLQEPLEHGVQATLKEGARAVERHGSIPRGPAVQPMYRVSQGARVGKERQHSSSLGGWPMWRTSAHSGVHKGNAHPQEGAADPPAICIEFSSFVWCEITINLNEFL